MNRITLTAVSAALALSALAAADFSHVEVRDVSKEIGTPAGLRSWRFIAVFTNDEDQVLAVAGNSDVPLEFDTNDPDGLFNDGGIFAGLKQEDFAAFPLAPMWDSWVTIRASTFSPNDTDYSPAFLNNDGINAVIVDASWSDDANGWFDSEPGTPETGTEVLIAQFTVGRSYGVRLAGSVVYRVSGQGNQVYEPFVAFSLSYCAGRACPSDLDASGDVTVSDLLIILANWGACAGDCPADIDGNGAVDFQDLLAVLVAWGPCQQPGACCFPDGSCLAACTPEGTECTEMGGVYQGVETICDNATCPQPGACCFNDATCAQAAVLGGADCASAGGTYQGDETLCADVICPQIGACCFPDDTCEILMDTLCLDAGGSFAGAGTTCTVDCTRGPCCLPDGSCVFTTPEFCTDIGGVYQGDGIPCAMVMCP